MDYHHILLCTEFKRQVKHLFKFRELVQRVRNRIRIQNMSCDCKAWILFIATQFYLNVTCPCFLDSSPAMLIFCYILDTFRTSSPPQFKYVTTFPTGHALSSVSASFICTHLSFRYYLLIHQGSIQVSFPLESLFHFIEFVLYPSNVSRA